MSPEREHGTLPPLLLIANRFTDPSREAVVERLIAEGPVSWLQMRDHRARRALFRGRGECLIERLREAREDLLVSVNTDVALARNLATGLHLGQRGPSVADARDRLGPDALIGFSAHDLDEASRAVEAGADYLTLSPVFPTDSKPGHPGIGLECLREVCRTLDSTPVFALGGITPDRVGRCLEAGAYGVAVLSGILYARDPIDAAASYMARL